MQEHEIPTHLNVEDRMLWFLTARQVGILLSGAALAYAAWENLYFAPAVARSTIVLLLAVAAVTLALVRPAGRGLEEWAFAWLHYRTLPAGSTWGVHTLAPTDRLDIDARREMWANRDSMRTER